MNENVNQKIKNILKDLRTAHQRSEQFSVKGPLANETPKPTDKFEMMLAFDNEKRLIMDLNLARAEKYPDRYSKDDIDFYRSERDRLTRRIRAWQNRQMPSHVRE